MNSSPANTVEGRQSVLCLRDRCDVLRAAMWIQDAPSRPLRLQSTVDEVTTRLLRSQNLEKRLVLAVRLADEQSTDEFIPHCRVLVDPMEVGGDRAGNFVTLFCSAGFDETELFERMCEDAGITLAEGRESFAPLLASCPEETEIRVQSYRWSYEDVLSKDDNHRAITDLSDQLGDSFEQIVTLHQIGRSMTDLSNPREFLKHTCELILHVLDYAWIGFQYANSELSITGMANRLVMFGDSAFSRSELTRVVRPMMDAWDQESGTTVLLPGEHPIADLVESTVIVAPIMKGDHAVGAIIAGGKCGPDSDATSAETQLIESCGEFLSIFHQNFNSYRVQRRAFLGTVRALSNAIDAKDEYTRGHSDRVATLAQSIGRVLGWNQDALDTIHICGLVHDVGKIGVPEAVLCKPGKLTDEEFEIIKAHPVIGHEILEEIPAMEAVLDGVLHHHERWDGGGYPHGLAGEDIPLQGRVLAVADAFDAMSSNRAYRPGMPRDRVIEILSEGAGTQWDPTIIEAFLKINLSVFDCMLAAATRSEAKAA